MTRHGRTAFLVRPVDDWVTNVLELYSREAIRNAKLIANPGCYATNMQMLLAPLLPHTDLSRLPTVVGISGYSGAGTKSGGRPAPGERPVTLPKLDPASLNGAVRPYSLTDHIHEREARYHLSTLVSQGSQVQIAFTPMVAPWFQGIISTAIVPLATKLSARDVKQLYEDKYGHEKLVEILPRVPEISDIALKHGFKVGGVQVHSSGDHVVVVGVIDNLLKGAATQCLQNINLALGFDEHAGIPRS